jgi:hypothetical protein
MTILAATCRPEVPPERLLDVARAAADAGLDELWLWEDCFWGGAAAATAAEQVRPLVDDSPQSPGKTDN